MQFYERKLYDKKLEIERKCRQDMNLFEKELALENANDEEEHINALIQKIRSLKAENAALKR